MKLNSVHSRNQQQFQARLQLQRDLRRREKESVTDLLVGSERFAGGLFKSADAPPPRVFQSIDELVLAGNQTFENLDNVDFAGFRNDKELGAKVLKEARAEVAKLHPEGESEGFRADLRRVLNARYLQGHGVQVQSHLDGAELARLRRYIQAQDSAMNVADAVRAINSSLEKGEQDPSQLLLGAERHLYQERGIDSATFETKFAQLSLNQIGQLRDFSDGWAVSQSGQYLLSAEGRTPEEMRDSITRQLLKAQGYQNPAAVDQDTALSLLRDRNTEGPRTNATLARAVNAGIAAGETDYFKLTTLANQAILEEIGVSSKEQKRLRVSDKELRESYPDLEPGEARAIRTRVLRDLLRVLPDEERRLALDHLIENEGDLITAEEILGKHFGERIRHFSGYSTGYGEMGAMQRANLTSALSRMPEEARLQAFAGRTARAQEKETKARLEAMIESQFGVEIHRQAGKSADGNESYDPFVQDFTVQGMVDVYNALTSMSKNGRLPVGISGTTTLSFMAGAPTPASMTPVSLRERPALAEEPWDRPGADAYQKGKSGFFGECGQNDKGHDGVVIYDDALYGANGDSAVGLSLGEATIIHELGHAIQLGGTPGASEESRKREDALRMAEWSSLSRWTEPGQLLADGRLGSFEYYYDPTVQVKHRQEVATSYGASDPCEDFAEYTPFFFKDPDTALGLSLEKFLYYNQLVGEHYSSERVKALAAARGISAEQLEAARQSMQVKVAAAPAQAGLAA